MAAAVPRHATYALLHTSADTAHIAGSIHRILAPGKSLSQVQDAINLLICQPLVLAQ